MSVRLIEHRFVFLQIIFLGHAPLPIEVNRSMSEALICWESSNCLALKTKINIYFEEVKTLTSTNFFLVKNNCF